MFEHISAVPTRAPAGAVRAPINVGADSVVDLLRAIARYTSPAQVSDFTRLLFGRLHEAAGGFLNDRETEILHQMALQRLDDLKNAREQRLPLSKSFFPTRPKSERSRSEAASGRRHGDRWARKQRLGGLAALPPTEEYRGFTEGERATLYIIAADMREFGACRCTAGEIADRAGVGVTTVRNAIRKAKHRGLIRVTNRPQWRNKWLSNVITIVCETWLGWLRRFRPNLGFKFKGVKKPTPIDTHGQCNKDRRPFYHIEDGPLGRLQRVASRKRPSK